MKKVLIQSTAKHNDYYAHSIEIDLKGRVSAPVW